MGDVRRVLSIDGGGIRGIIPAVLLDHIEKETGKRICDMFDLIAGTSTGGIIALALSRPAEGGAGPALRAEDLVALYGDQGADIFHVSPWKTVTSLGGLIDEKYNADALEAILADKLAAASLSDALTNLLVPAYRISPSQVGPNGRPPDKADRTPYFFKSWRAQGKHLRPDETAEQRDYLMRDIARATSAAPTYFEAAAIQNKAGERWAFLDGGVFANNPAMCAYVSAKRLFDDDDEIRVLSLGTGELERPVPYDDAKDWGLAEWARPIVHILMDGVEDTVHYQLKDLLGDGYLRFQPDLGPNGGPGPNDDMDDASAGNIQRLRDRAAQLLTAKQAEMQALIDELKQP